MIDRALLSDLLWFCVCVLVCFVFSTEDIMMITITNRTLSFTKLGAMTRLLIQRYEALPAGVLQFFSPILHRRV